MTNFILTSGSNLIFVLFQIYVLSSLNNESLTKQIILFDISLVLISTIAIYGGEKGVFNSLKKNKKIYLYTSLLLFSIIAVLSFYFTNKNETSLFILTLFMIFIFEYLTIIFKYKSYALGTFVNRFVYMIIIASSAYIYQNYFNEVFILITLISSLFLIIKLKISSEIFMNKKYDSDTNHILFTNIFVFIYERLDQILLSTLVTPFVLTQYFLIIKTGFAAKFLTRNLLNVRYKFSIGKKDGNRLKNDLIISMCLNIFVIINILLFKDYLYLFLNIDFKDADIVLFSICFILLLSPINLACNNFFVANGFSYILFLNSIILTTLFVIPLIVLQVFLNIEIIRSIVICKLFSSIFGIFLSYYFIKKHDIKFD